MLMDLGNIVFPVTKAVYDLRFVATIGPVELRLPILERSPSLSDA